MMHPPSLPTETDAIRTRVPLTERPWRFLLDPEDEGEAGGFSEPGLNDGNWTPVFLPATYEQLCPEVDHYEGAGWFRLRMKVDPAWRGRTVVFAGGGNSGRCQVWINGRLLINQEDPWLPFEARVPDDLVASGSLQLAVRTDNRPEPALVPGREYGWRNFGGITRPLFLEIVPRRRLAPPLVIPTLRDGVGRIRLKCQPAERTEAMKGLVRVTLHDGPGLSGQRVLRNRRLPAADGTAIVDCGTVEPWSPAHPNLYTLRCEWVDNEGGILDAVSRRVGFRQVRSAEGRILLNGEPIFLRGFNLHEDRAGAGPCEDPDGARADLEAMKAAGANAVRLAHYPHAASTLDLCDELGLLVLSEIPLYWLRRQGLNEAEFSAKAGRAARQLDALIQRDAHRPSVMLWAVSNETLEGDPAVREVNHNLIMRARELDPTRLVAHVSCHFWHYEPDGPNFANDDAICVNAYPTWWDTDARKGPTSSLPQRGADFWHEQVGRFRRTRPDRPVIVTEFGHPGLRFGRNTLCCEELQGKALEAQFKAIHDAGASGALVWLWADHAWPRSGFEVAGKSVISPFGVLTRDRKTKESLRMLTQRWKAEEPPSGTDGGKAGPAGYSLAMVRTYLAEVPAASLPTGFRLRPMSPRDASLWTLVQREAEPYFEIGDQLFDRTFGGNPSAIPHRCFLIEDDQGVAAGTISAWYNDRFRNQSWGQVHWVAVRPAYQRRGLARAGLAMTLQLLARWHDRALLFTQSRRAPAIRLYLEFGFEPVLASETDRMAWADAERHLKQL